MAKLNIYEIESPEYRIENKKLIYTGNSVSFLPAKDRKEAKSIYEKTYKKPFNRNTVRGKKEFFIDTKDTKYTLRKDYNKLFKND